MNTNTREAKILVDGFDYTIKDSQGHYHRYRCSSYRRTKCTAEVKIHRNNNLLIKTEELHTCQPRTLENSSILDLKEEMRSQAIDLAKSDFSLTATEIYNRINFHMNETYKDTSGTITKLARNKLINLVMNKRLTLNNNAEGVELEKYSTISTEDKRLFLRFKFKFEMHNNRTGDQMLSNILLWAHPDLSPLLRRKYTACYIDGTFRCVPRPFKQCMILMLFDDETELYVPIIYALMTSRSEWAYWHFLNLVISTSNFKFEPRTFTVDFETALIESIKQQFNNPSIIGCLFHYKQALRKRMSKLHISPNEISKAMKQDSFERLTITKRSKLDEEIRKLKTEFNTENDVKWHQFFDYFQRTWMKEKIIDTWNISTLKKKGVKLQNRTNNALENFNRQFNSRFSGAHPNIFNFIDTIKTISCEYVEKIKDAKLHSTN